MPTMIDARGATVYLSDDDARRLARDLVAKCDRAVARAESFGLSESDGRRVAEDYAEAERLFAEVGDTKLRYDPIDQVVTNQGRQRHVPPTQDVAARAVDVLRQIEALAEHDDDDDGEPPKKALRMRRIGESRWVVEGGGRPRREHLTWKLAHGDFESRR